MFGVVFDVSDGDIGSVYCKLVIKYYLDSNFEDEDVVVWFKEVVEVYEVFGD